MAGRYTAVIAWALVDLTFGVCAASLPMLSTVLPRAWRSEVSRGHGSSYYTNAVGIPGSTGTYTTNITASCKGAMSRGTRHSLYGRNNDQTITVQEEVELTYDAAEPGRSQSGAEGSSSSSSGNKYDSGISVAKPMEIDIERS